MLWNHVALLKCIQKHIFSFSTPSGCPIPQGWGTGEVGRHCLTPHWWVPPLMMQMISDTGEWKPSRAPPRIKVTNSL
jgi:hypothetical protein